MQKFDSSQLFVPGRSLYLTSGLNGTHETHLSESSRRRAEIAAIVFNPNFHTTALFSGGYPGVSDGSSAWPVERIPTVGNREADLMAVPLEERMTHEGWSPAQKTKRILKETESDNSFGNVLRSIEYGYLNPEDFHDQTAHGIQIVAGKLHATRLTDILAKALDINRRRIVRVEMRDVYGRQKTEFIPKELAAIGTAKEMAALALTRLVLRGVKPGDIEGLYNAEQKFMSLANRDS